MSKDDKSESINFENEQIEQRTLNSDEERKIKKPEESKTSTTNNFNKVSKAQKNKSQNKSQKTKLPPIYKSKKDPLYSSSQRENTTSSVFTTSYSTVNIDQKDNDKLFLELNKAQKEMKNINKELKMLKNEYNLLEESNITNKYIIEKILNTCNDPNIEQILKNEKINYQEEYKINEKKENENLENNRNNKNKKKSTKN